MDNITGNRIKRLRLELNLTQEKLGDILHVTKQSVSKWERGTNIPEPPILKQLASIFNCSTDYLLGTTDVKTPPLNTFSDKNTTTLTNKDENDLEKNIEKAKSIIATFKKAGIDPDEIDLKELEMLIRGYYMAKNNTK